MLYLIGLGLNEKSISLEGLTALAKCKKVYLENYTVDFPYMHKELEKVIKKKLLPANRELAESDKLVKEAKKENVALLVYGSPLTATTHISLIEEAKKQKVKYEVIYNASILDAIAETGLQLYKFGKITSMPAWKESFKPISFIGTIEDNQKIGAHSLMLVDIGLELKEALNQFEKALEENEIKVGKILICSRLGNKDRKIFYAELSKLKNKKVEKPYCIIIPAKLHFMEEEVLKGFE